MKGMGGAVLDDSIARAIHSKRGLGRVARLAVSRRRSGESMGHDFSDVNIHRDSEADKLNKSVQAEAFTTGKDVFFREGKYDPVSNEGQKLLAHELTHVVQQRDAPPAQELKVSDPNEASEKQAHSVADAVTSPGAKRPAGAGGGSVGRVQEEEAATHAMRGEEEGSPATARRRCTRASSARSGGAGGRGRCHAGRSRRVGGAGGRGRRHAGRARGAEEQEDEGVATQVARAERRSRRTRASPRRSLAPSREEAGGRGRRHAGRTRRVPRRRKRRAST